MKTAPEIASDLLALFEVKPSKQEPDKNFTGFKLDVISDGGPEYQAISDAIHGSDTDSNHTYEWTYDALSAFSDVDANDWEDGAERVIDEIEADVYTSDLTDWLSANNGNVSYIDEAIREGFSLDVSHDGGDGFSLLSQAQMFAMREVYQAALEAVNGLFKEQEED